MKNSQKTIVIVGGAIAIIGQFWGAEFYLPLFGGIVAIIGAFLPQ